MKNLRYYIFLFMLGTLAIACRNDITELTETETSTHEPTVFVNTLFNGFVFDEAGEALENVLITMNNNDAYTDSRGFFQISGKVNSTGAYISADLEGYYKAHGNIIPSPDNTGHVRFTLKVRTEKGIIDSDSDTKISLENGSEVSFRANSFMDEDGNPYQGKVTVFADYIDPSASNFGSVMPGDLSAVTVENEAVILQSFGMLNVELESESGEQLQINQKATLKVKVPDANLNTAQNEIPLWYFDTSDGLWKEDGYAVLDNGYYIGEVAHFTLWNCDVPFPFVVLSGNIFSRGPIPNLKVKITWVETGEMRTTYTDDEGDFSGKVPANVDLLLEIIDECGVIIYSEEIGPLLEDTFVSIGLTPEEYDFFTVSGSLECDGSPVTFGYALIELDNGGGIHSVLVDAQGNFSVELLNCNSANITITPIDLGVNEQGDLATFPIETVMEIGQLSACGNEIEFLALITYKDGLNNDQSYTILNPILDSIFVNQNGTNYDITTIDDSYEEHNIIKYNFAFWPNGNRYMGFSLFSYGPVNFRVRIKDELSGTPESFQIIETAEYVEFYVPVAEVLYSSFGSTQTTYEGSFLIRAKK